MPLIAQSGYGCRWWWGSGHVQTVAPLFLRGVQGARGVWGRERLELEDGDFLDLDWWTQSEGVRLEGTRRLAVLSHGLEGESVSVPMVGLARAFFGAGWDVLVWNYRACSGEMNRLRRFYHSGASDDLERVVRFALGEPLVGVVPSTGKLYAGDEVLGLGRGLGPSMARERGVYSAVVLSGVSLGGNISVKYLCEPQRWKPPGLIGAAVASVPCDLGGCAQELSRPGLHLYMEYFLKKMRAKVREKARLFPGSVDAGGCEGLRSFEAFDERFTAPLNGFASAVEYWHFASCKPLLSQLEYPVWMVQPEDDPFLSESCYPVAEARVSEQLHLELPEDGGHGGFLPMLPGGVNWFEQEAVRWAEARVR